MMWIIEVDWKLMLNEIKEKKLIVTWKMRDVSEVIVYSLILPLL